MITVFPHFPSAGFLQFDIIQGTELFTLHLSEMNSVLKDYLRKPDITFHANGRIDITAKVALGLGLSAGDTIDISDAGGEQYLFIRHKSTSNSYSRYEAICSPTNRGKKRCNNFRCYSRKLSEFILLITKQNQVAKLNVGQPMRVAGMGLCLPILTSKYNK